MPAHHLLDLGTDVGDRLVDARRGKLHLFDQMQRIALFLSVDHGAFGSAYVDAQDIFLHFHAICP